MVPIAFPGPLFVYLYDIEQLMSVYAAVAIHIIKSEVPAQFVLHFPSHYETQCCYILHEVYVTILQRKQSQWYIQYVDGKGPSSATLTASIFF